MCRPVFYLFIQYFVFVCFALSTLLPLSRCAFFTKINWIKLSLCQNVHTHPHNQYVTQRWMRANGRGIQTGCLSSLSSSSLSLSSSRISMCFSLFFALCIFTYFHFDFVMCVWHLCHCTETNWLSATHCNLSPSTTENLCKWKRSSDINDDDTRNSAFFVYRMWLKSTFVLELFQQHTRKK